MPPLNQFLSFTDQQLVDAYVRQGDQTAFGVLFKRYSHLVFGLCLHYLKNQEEAKDALMDIFEKVATQLPKREVEHFKSWLYFVARNHCLNRVRDQYKVVYKDIETPDDTTTAQLEWSRHPKEIEEKQLEVLNNAIDALKPHHRECIIRFYLQKESYASIAQETGYDLKTVKSYIQNGKRNLKNLILQMQHE